MSETETVVDAGRLAGVFEYRLRCRVFDVRDSVARPCSKPKCQNNAELIVDGASTKLFCGTHAAKALTALGAYRVD